MRQSLKKKEKCEKVSKEHFSQGSLRKRTRRDRDGDRDESKVGRGRRWAHLFVVLASPKSRGQAGYQAKALV